MTGQVLLRQMHAVCLLGCLDYEHQFNHLQTNANVAIVTLSKILGCVNKSTGVRFDKEASAKSDVKQ
ncbi:hypothetical protein RIR_jg17527.t1 [Rhizophagus irregularis DAOM 181602=DAOM 197198]|nr:hypothetical protein RIR_jg17527.t1 [Rhizophagus irregularis DAOM 181602=DAOM 197198]CAB4469594.1 unnamed protein product [Rhizophagus irregularis]